MAQYVYYRGSQGSRETVTYDIVRGSQYITTCVVDVQLLLCGVKAFPCGNGDDVKLTAQQRLEILETVRDERGVRRPTFTTFHDLGGGYWQFDGYCFYKENTNRYTRKPRIEELIDEARREVGTDG